MACVSTLDHAAARPPWPPGQMCVTLTSRRALESEVVPGGDACEEQ